MQALRDGFRLIDSAQADEWYNEVDAGKAIRTFIAESGGKVKRDDLWITTKVRKHPARRCAEDGSSMLPLDTALAPRVGIPG